MSKTAASEDMRDSLRKLREASERRMRRQKVKPSGVSEAEWGKLLRMEKAGLISLGTGELPEEFWEMPMPNDPEGAVLRALLEEREEGR